MGFWDTISSWIEIGGKLPKADRIVAATPKYFCPVCKIFTYVGNSQFGEVGDCSTCGVILYKPGLNKELPHS